MFRTARFVWAISLGILANVAIDLESSQGPGITTIRAVGGQVVRIGPFGSIEGFTIAGGSAPSGAGLAVLGSGTIIRRNVFENNRQSGHGYVAAIAGSGGAGIIRSGRFRGLVESDYR